MRIVAVHVSDLHIREGRDGEAVMKMSEAFSESVKEALEPADIGFIVVSGDLAFSGTSKEYAIAKRFFGELIKSLDSRIDKVVRVITPGNHDCDLLASDPARSILIEKLIEDRSTAKDDLSSHILRQNDYGDFQQAFNSQVPTRSFGKLCEVYEVEKDGVRVAIISLNSSWMSSLKEQGRTLGFPDGLYNFLNQDALQAEHDLVVVAMHHSLHWFSVDDDRKLRHFFESKVDVVLSGHEHSSENFEVSIGDRQATRFVAGDVFFERGQPSGFNVLDLESGSKKGHFDLAIGRRIFDDNSFDSVTEPLKVSLISKKAHPYLSVRVSDAFTVELNQMSVPIYGGSGKQLDLSDVFVWPQVRPEPRDGRSKSDIRESLDFIRETPLVMVTGDQRSGKSSLARKLFLAFEADSLVPVFLSGDRVRAQTEQKFEQIVNKEFGRQWGSGTSYFQAVPIARRYLIVDEFDSLGKSVEARSRVLRFALKRFERIVVIGAVDPSYRSLLGEEVGGADLELYLQFEKCHILPLGFEKRAQIIRKWVDSQKLEGRKEDLHTLVLNAEREVSSLVARHLLPSSPVFLLMLLQQMEVSKENSSNLGSHGDLYQAVITAQLVRTVSESGKLDILHTFLSFFANKVFRSNGHSLSVAEASALQKEYESARGIRLHYSAVERLVDAELLQQNSGRYRFAYEHVRYFYTAKFLGDNVGQASVVEDIRSLAEGLHREDYANIFVFLPYFTRSDEVSQIIVSKANSVFQDYKEFEAFTPITWVEGMKVQQPKLVLDVGNVERNYEDTLRDRDRGEALNENVPPEPEPDSVAERGKGGFVDQFNSGNRLIQIIGQLLRNYPGSTDRQHKVLLAKTCYSLGFRMSGAVLTEMERGEADFRNAIESIALRNHPSADIERIREEVNHLIYALVSSMPQSVVKRVSEAIGMRELLPVFEGLASVSSSNEKQNSIKPSATNDALMSAVLSMDYGVEFPQKEILAVFESAKRIGVRVTQDLIRRLVWYRFFLHHEDRAIMQSTCQALGIPIGKALIEGHPDRTAARVGGA